VNSGTLEAGGPAPRAADAYKEELLGHHAFLTSAQVAERAHCAVLGRNSGRFASRLRCEGRLLGAKRGVQYLHPAFQFGDNGEVLPAMLSLFPLLPTEERDGGWARVFWCFQPHAGLDGQSPAEVFPNDAQRVIDVARQDAVGTGDSDW
jgi:hypothetical protein